MGKADYKRAQQLLTLVDRARSGSKLSIAVIKQELRVQKATAARILKFVKKNAGLRSRVRGGRKIHEMPSEREGAFLRVATLELALVSMSWLRDTPYYAHLKSLTREIRSNVAVEDHDGLERFVRSFHFKRREAAFDHRLAETTSGLVRAIRERRVCCVTYRKLDGQVGDYVLEPWSLMLIGDATFVLAHERARKEPRTFELSSIVSLVVSEETFTPPSRAESDVNALLGSSIGSYNANFGALQDVTLRARGQAAEILRRRPLHGSQTVEPGTDGWATIRLRVIACPELTAVLLSLLPDVRVVGPASLRNTVRHAAMVVMGSDWDPGDP